MSRSDLVVSLAKAGAAGDRPMLTRTVKALAEEARARQQHTYAARLTDILGGKEESAGRLGPARARVSDAVRDMVVETTPGRRLDDLILPRSAMEDLADFLEEHGSYGLLRANSLEPRHTILLIGPPGNGKTSLAEAIAAEIGCVFLVVRYEALIGSYLGETASNLRKVLDYAVSMPCVLFFDEFDAIGKDRGELHENGEVKRVVNSLLVQMDALPSHCILVGATNHPEMLDKAIWRRFEIALELPNPNHSQVVEWFSRFLVEIGSPPDVNVRRVAKSFRGRSFAELEQFVLDVRRRRVLRGVEEEWSASIDRVLERWLGRLRAVVSGQGSHAYRISDPEARGSGRGEA